MELMDIQYGQPGNLMWLLPIALLVISCMIALSFHRQAMLRFATANLLSNVVPSGGFVRRLISIFLTASALALLAIALVDIRWGKIWREVPQKGVEVIFALDVSRSMLAEDTAPNRLERAKQDIKDMIGEMAGDRVGLILFAGDVKRHIPLTSHYEDFRQTLEEVGPHDVPRGGSNLGEAITVATESFLEKTADHRAIVLFTDGEDNVSKPVEAARVAHAETGVRIFTVGLGDMDQGAPIPVQEGRRRSYVRYNGEQVVSKLNGDVLEKIAKETNGAWIPAGTRQVDMAGVYHRFIASMDQQEFETARINTYVARYPLFVGAALLLLLVDIMASARHPKETESRAFAEANPLVNSKTDREAA